MTMTGQISPPGASFTEPRRLNWYSPDHDILARTGRKGVHGFLGYRQRPCRAARLPVEETQAFPNLEAGKRAYGRRGLSGAGTYSAGKT